MPLYVGSLFKGTKVALEGPDTRYISYVFAETKDKARQISEENSGDEVEQDPETFQKSPFWSNSFKTKFEEVSGNTPFVPGYYKKCPEYTSKGPMYLWIGRSVKGTALYYIPDYRNVVYVWGPDNEKIVRLVAQDAAYDEAMDPKTYKRMPYWTEPSKTTFEKVTRDDAFLVA